MEANQDSGLYCSNWFFLAQPRQDDVVREGETVGASGSSRKEREKEREGETTGINNK